MTNPKAALETSAPRHVSPPHVITRRAVASWVLYDLANTIFSMGVISLFMPEWLEGIVGKRAGTSVGNYVNAISMGIIFFVSPLLGAMTDRARRRLPFLTFSTLVCVVLTAFMGRVGYVPTLILFILANIAYQAGTQFYDALLPEVSTEANRGRIGGIGVGVGYLGSFIAVAVGLLFSHAEKPFMFLMVAVTFLLFAIPCMLFVTERGNPNPRPINWEAIRGSTRETLKTLRSGHEYPGLLRFLLGRMFYTDAVNTVITNMTYFVLAVAATTGLSDAAGSRHTKYIFLCAISFAVVGGFVWGRIVDWQGPKRTLNLVLYLWIAIYAFASLVGILGWPLWTMYVVGTAAGIAMGGTWSADRPYMLRLTPPHRVGEFYGLYGMVGRFSAVTGPVLYALVYDLTTLKFAGTPLQGHGVAVLTLLAMVLVSYVILQPVSDQQRDWEALRDRQPESQPAEPAPKVS